MQRNFNKYQYETSPRKIIPEYAPKKNNYKGKKSTTRNPKKNNKKKEKQQKRKTILYISAVFAILFAVCYRNARIDENFEKVQDLKKELAVIEKENAQLAINIESNMNLNNIEKQAKELLGMQKLTNKQIVYVNLEKDDHIETAAENVKIEEPSKIKQIVKKIVELFK